MGKLGWVLWPLALLLLVVAVQVLRGRRPSRLSLNIGFSLLLLLYLAATAGLGLFWVANQQLPVFDWHYLFGYVTLALVLLHLGFNARVVWGWWRRRSGVARADPAHRAPAQSARRRLLGGAGLWPVLASLGAGGAGYWLGLRQGRAVVDLASSAGPAPTPSAGAAEEHALRFVERFHARTSHNRAGVLRQVPVTAWGPRPDDFKAYPGASTVALPPPARSAAAARQVTPQDPVAMVGSLLWHGAGVSAQRGPLALRCAPSSGALFSSELYLWVPAGAAQSASAWAGLAGCWHHAPQTHALERLPIDAPDTRAWLADAAAMQPPCLARLVVSAVFARSGHKYGDRTYRYVLADAGHLLENLRVAAAALGLAVHVEADFDDQAVARSLGLAPAEEGVLALLTLTPASTSAAPGRVPRPKAMAAATAPAPRWPAAAGAPDLTQAMHLASGLGAVATAPAPATTPSMPVDSATQPPKPAVLAEQAITVALPATDATQPDMLALIARRRSVRRYHDEALPWPRLAAVLAVLADAPSALSTALRIDLVATRVQGLGPGAWRLEPAQRHLQLRRKVPDSAALRRQARGAALDQDVVGDAAALLVLSLARPALAADPQGPARAWRHALLEAGLVGERVYLAAGAQGLAVCAVGAFYDDEAAALVASDPAHEWVLHFVALGLPA